MTGSKRCGPEYPRRCISWQTALHAVALHALHALLPGVTAALPNERPQTNTDSSQAPKRAELTRTSCSPGSLDPPNAASPGLRTPHPAGRGVERGAEPARLRRPIPSADAAITGP